MNPNPTAFDLRTRLHGLFDEDKEIMVDTGDGIFTIADVTEEMHEIIIHLGPMP